MSIDQIHKSSNGSFAMGSPTRIGRAVARSEDVGELWLGSSRVYYINLEPMGQPDGGVRQDGKVDKGGNGA